MGIILAYGLFSYLVGAIPTGYLISKYVAHVNIQNHGSGNMGATNMTRVLGKKYGFLTLAIDVSKSYGVVKGAQHFLFLDWAICFSAAALLLGNCYSVFLKGRGGKGVATTFGIYGALSPFVCFIGVGVYGILAWMIKLSAAGSLGAAVIFPVALYMEQQKIMYGVLGFILSSIVIYRHKKNIHDFMIKAKCI
ncbi:MAG: glycerol-3-phosphate acyltransferase [Deltaproteobacteria bacterium]|nr:glycerol-3-phosphate acyltransferase [Deltaproteobacteria bacterium]